MSAPAALEHAENNVMDQVGPNIIHHVSIHLVKQTHFIR